MAIKVTDRRMFDEKGELRSGSAADSVEEEERPSAPIPESSTVSSAPEPVSQPASEPPRAAESKPAAEPPPNAQAGAAPSVQFVDLVRMLAEPVALYLGDLPMPDGQSVKDLDRARLHIDLLDVLRDKTRGNLAPEEDRVFEDLLYQLRLRYVQARDGA